MRHLFRLTAPAGLRPQASALTFVLAASAAFIFAPGSAHAVMKGHSAGGISRHVVKLVGHNLLCTATVIGRQSLLTANHCVEGSGPFFVVAGGKRIAVTSHSGAGQVTQLTLASPLPGNIVPIETGSAASGGTFTIAGYGTAQESQRMRSAGLREARLVTDSRYGGLVDPQRRGPISASACMGDSGGPVARFDGKRYVLVGIVERVSNFAGVGACGFLTHFSTVSGASNYANVPSGATQAASEPRGTRVAHKKHRKQWAAR
jgi:hypothetical protein